MEKSKSFPKMPLPPHVFDEMVHKALSSDIRKRILLALAEQPCYLTQIAEIVGKKPQTVDFHLNVLAEIGLVESEWKEGKKYYELIDPKIIRFLREGKAVPPEFRPKPPHEIVLDAWQDITGRLERIERRLERIDKKIR